MWTNVYLKNGKRVPQIGMGTFKLKDENELTQLLDNCLELNYKLIDSAACYKNEFIIGKWLEKQPQKVLITTKIAPNMHGREKCAQSVKSSINNLRMNQIDLMLIHWPGVAGLNNNSLEQASLRMQTYEELEHQVELGNLSDIGVSNYNEEHLRQLLERCEVRPLVNQVEMHPFLNQQNLRDFCDKNNILIQAYSPLGSADGYSTLSQNKVITRIAGELNVTIPQLLIRWVIQHECVVLPKTSKLERLKSNIEVFHFEISQDQMNELDSLNCDEHFCWNPNKVL